MAKFDGVRLLSISVRVYRSLLIAYPCTFRRAYAADMTQLFADLVHQSWQCQGRRGLVRLWLHTLADLLTSALDQRVASLPKVSPRLAVRVALMFLVVSAMLEFARI